MIKRGLMASVFLFIFMIATLNLVSSAIIPTGSGSINTCEGGPKIGFNWDNRSEILNSTTGFNILEPRYLANANLTSIGMTFFSPDDGSTYEEDYQGNFVFEVGIEPIASQGILCGSDPDCPTEYYNFSAPQIDYTCVVNNKFKQNYGQSVTDQVYYAEFSLNETYLKSIGGFVVGSSNYPNNVWYNITVKEIYINGSPIVSTFDYVLDMGGASGNNNPLVPVNLTVKNLNFFSSSSESVKWTDIYYGDSYTSRNYGTNPLHGNSFNVSVSNLGDYFIDDTPVKVEIYEKDVSSNDSIRTGTSALEGIVRDGSLNVTWIISEDDIITAGVEDYYEFFVKLMTFPNHVSDHYSSDINISNNSVQTDLSNAWGDWMDDLLFENYTGESIAYSNTSDTLLSIKVYNITATTGTVVYFDIYEDDGVLGDDEIRVDGIGLNGTVAADGTSYVIWEVNSTDILNGEQGLGDNENVTAGSDVYKEFEYYFRIRVDSEEKTMPGTQVQLTQALGQILQCNLITYCSDYTNSADCNADSCLVGSSSQPSSLVDCSDSNIFCSCSWNSTTSTCGPDHITRSGGVDIGRCSYNEDLSQDDCSDGVLSYSWTAAWQWATSNTGLGSDPEDDDYIQDGALWYFDPDRASLECQGGTNTRVCPAKVQLDFFSWFNVVLAILILVGVYYFINKNKSTKKKTSKKKK